MPPESKKLLADMLEFANSISEFSQDKTLEDFKRDKLLRAGIYYCFTIVGEALAQLRQLNATVAERISEYPRIIGFRNQIIHGYIAIRDETTWQIIQDKLPILRRELEQLLAE